MQALCFVSALRHASFHGTFACSEECTNFTLARMGNELLNQGTSSEESRVPTILLVSSSLLFHLDMDGLSARFEEAQPRVIQVGVDQAGDDIVDLLHRYHLMLLLAEENFESILEDAGDLDPDCQHNHRHYERPERSFALSPSFALIALLDLGDLNEELLQMEWV